MSDPDDEALLRWASQDGGDADLEPAPVAPAAPQIALPPAPVGFVNAWDPGLNRYILMPAATRAAAPPLQHVAHPTTVAPANPPGGMGRVIPFRPRSNMLVKQAGLDPYDAFVQGLPEIPIPGLGSDSETDGMAGNYDPALTAEIAQVQSEIRTSTPGLHQGHDPMQGEIQEAVGDLNYPDGSSTIKDLPRG